MVHVSHADGTDCKTTDGGDLGWTDIETAEQMVNEQGDER